MEARVGLAEVYTKSAPEGVTDQEAKERQEKLEKASGLLEEANDLDPESAEIKVRLADAYTRTLPEYAPSAAAPQDEQKASQRRERAKTLLN